MTRESSKSREWEKDRRNRLNEAFNVLSKLLPTYDPSATTSKIDILRNASTHIEDLQNKVKELMSNGEESVKNIKGEEIRKLNDRIKRLLGKNEQLSMLMREAKIAIPRGCGMIRKIKTHLYWSNKILPEQAKILQKKEHEKENEVSNKPKKSARTKDVQNNTPKHRKAILSRSDSTKVKVKKRKMKAVAPSVIVLSQPNMTQPCYVITNAASNILENTAANPQKSKNIKTASVHPLGPGTLILANGTIMPVVHQQTVLPQIITKPMKHSNQTIILLPQTPTTTVPSTTIKPNTTTLAQIRPKYCLTRTTQVNKVPIPALTSRYANNDLVLIETKNKKPLKKNIKEHEKTKEDNKTGEKRKHFSSISTEDTNKKTKLSDTASHPNKSICQGQVMSKINCQKISEPEVEENKGETKRDTSGLDLNSELSNDIFASLQVPTGGQNPDSTSPTAAFLLAFPLVSSFTGVKVTEVTEEDNAVQQTESPTLLQIGTMETTKPTQSESFTPNLLNLDNLSFFSSKDFYTSLESSVAATKVEKNQHRTNLGYFEAALSNEQNTYQSKEKQTNYQNGESASIKSYPEPLYTNSNSYNYNYPTDSNISYKNITKADNRSYYSLSYENYSDYKKSDSSASYYGNTKFSQNKVKNAPQPKGPINWMTDNRAGPSSSEFFPQVTKEGDFGHSPIYTNTQSYYSVQQNNKNHDVALAPPVNTYQKSDVEDNQFSWSPTKIPQFLDPNHSCVSSTLPTLVGDLALGNPLTFAEQKQDKCVKKQAPEGSNNRPRLKNLDSNFLSVSQLVDHNKSEMVPASRTNVRQNSGNRAHSNKKTQRKDIAKVDVHSSRTVKHFNVQQGINDLFCDTKNRCNKSSYSAEALIGNQMHNSDFTQKNRHNMPAFLSDNIIPYFAPCDLPSQDNSYIQHNQNFHTFPTSLQNNNYAPNTFSIPTATSNSFPISTATSNSLSINTATSNSFPIPTVTSNSFHIPTVSSNSFPIPTATLNSFPLSTGTSNAFPNPTTAAPNSFTFPTATSNSFPIPTATSNSFHIPTATPNSFTINTATSNSFPNPSITSNVFSTPTTTTISSNYLGGSHTFMHDLATSDYSTDNLTLFPSQPRKDKLCSKNMIRINQPNNCISTATAATTTKKSAKRKHINDIPHFVDFSFLTMSGSINSPILPDDFHVHTGFLQPPNPPVYSCKNSLYPKQNDLVSLLPLPSVTRSSIQHPEISPSSNNVGTSLTNFNLSTIFPEINHKTALPDSYLEPRIKDSLKRPYSSTVQVSFNDKTPFSFSYMNGTTSQPYNNQ